MPDLNFEFWECFVRLVVSPPCFLTQPLGLRFCCLPRELSRIRQQSSPTSPSPSQRLLPPILLGSTTFLSPLQLFSTCYSINIVSAGLFIVGSHNLGADKRSVTNSRDKERFDVHFKNKPKENREKAKQIKAGKTTKTFKQCKCSQIVTS